MELANTKYDRSLYPGKAVFYYQTEDCEFVPLSPEVSYIRGKKSSFAEGYNNDETVKNNAPQNLAFANPLAIEECYVPPNVDAIYCRFSLRVQANSLTPSSCTNLELAEFLTELASSFKDCGGYDELALRYARNILLGTWLWRNQNTGDTQIIVKTSRGNNYQIPNTRLLTWGSKWQEQEQSTLMALSSEISEALTEPLIFWSADITAKIHTSFCQEIFPSQPLLTTDRKTHLQKSLSKTKCDNGVNAVAFHSVKIGAAIQLVDDWWSDEAGKRLRIHEYGADQNFSIAMRAPESGLDFFSIFKDLDIYSKALMESRKKSTRSIDPHLMYFFAVLVKGGVFTKKK